MKIYLLNPPFYSNFIRGARWQDTGRGGTLYYPIWLSYAAALVDKTHEIRLVDAPAWDWTRKKVINDIYRFRPDIIVIDSSFPSLNNDIEVANEIKQNYDAKIILVGPPTSQFPENILNNFGVDIVARFEYDFTIKEIADEMECGNSLENINGISYKVCDKIVHNPNREFTSSNDLDGIPFVSKIYKKHLNVNDYFLGSSLSPMIQIFTGRGCPYLCTFCGWPQTLMGRKYRTRSISNVLDELEWIQDNLDIKEVFFEDDTFTIDKKRVLEFCIEYKKRNLNIAWACNARVDLDYEIMRNMKMANCRLVIVGYESGNDDILKNIKKGTTVNKMKQFAKNARKARLLVHGDFVLGLPGETKETIAMTKQVINELKPELLQVSVASPFPGTDFYEWCKENDYLITKNLNEYLDNEGHQKSVISYPWLSSEEITVEVDEILRDYYVSLNYVPLAVRQVLCRHGFDEMRRLWYSMRKFLKYISIKK